MKMKWNFAFSGRSCKSAASISKLYAQAKISSIDSCQNGIRADYYQITNNVGSNTRSDNPPLQPGLKCLTHTRRQQSVYSKVRHSNDVQLTAVKLEHPLITIVWPYRGLRYRLTESEVTSFQMIAGSSSIFLMHRKYEVVFMSRTIKLLI